MNLEKGLNFGRAEISDSAYQELKNLADKLHGLRFGEQREVRIAVNTPPALFVAELGRNPKRYEFGGVINPHTGSVLVAKAPHEGDEFGAQVQMIQPRLNPDMQTSDDVLFHTHPTYETVGSGSKAHSERSLPSEEDYSAFLRLKLSEEEDGVFREVVGYIGAGGLVSQIKASGMRLRDATLIESGVKVGQLAKIKRELALSAPGWVKEFVSGSKNRAGIMAEINRYYDSRQKKSSKRYPARLQALHEALYPFIKDDESTAELVRLVSRDLPQYVSSVFLKNIGLTAEQARLVSPMLGLRTSLFQAVEGKQLKKLHPSKDQSFI